MIKCTCMLSNKNFPVTYVRPAQILSCTNFTDVLFLFIYYFFVREGLLVPLIGLPEQVSGNLDHGFTDLILVDTACVEAELYNLHFCSFISVGQRTNEVSLSTMSLLFISSWKKYCGIWLADRLKRFRTGLQFVNYSIANNLNLPDMKLLQV